jgi:hypothetical protein
MQLKSILVIEASKSNVPFRPGCPPMTLSTIREKYPELNAALDRGEGDMSKYTVPMEPSKFSKFSMRKSRASIIIKNKQEPPNLKTYFS